MGMAISAGSVTDRWAQIQFTSWVGNDTIQLMELDVIVIGAGHAGCEAALASARMGCKTGVFCLSVDKIGLMPCNPSIGGPAKGQIVGEVDALGGEMGLAADATMIQMKILNRSKGPAVQCLRSQNDKYAYSTYMKKIMQGQKNLIIYEEMVTDVLVEKKRITGVLTALNTYKAKTVIVTTGTFLQGKIHIGLTNYSAGRSGEESAVGLSDSLKKHGLRMGRLKTGTTPRLDSRSIDYSKMSKQPGDPECLRFSFKTPVNDRYKDPG